MAVALHADPVKELGAAQSLAPVSFASRMRLRERGWAVLLTVLVLLLRVWFARRVTFCGTPDSCFYLGVAQGLERYRAFHVRFVYDLLLPHLALPNAGIEYWRPGTSFFLLPLHFFGGVTLFGSAVVAALAGVLWASAAWYLGLRASGSRRVALASYALTLLLPPAWTGSLTPDSTMFYATAVAWCLALFTVQESRPWRDVLALSCIAIAALIRNDAPLLGAPIAVVLWQRWRVTGRPLQKGTSDHASALLYTAARLAGFALALLPMLWINRHVLGTAFPPGAGQAFFLTDLAEFSHFGEPVGAASMLARGLPFLLKLRAEAICLILYRTGALLLGYTALVLLAGWWPRVHGRWQERVQGRPGAPEALGPLLFAATLLLVYGLVLPAIGVFSALRSVVGVLPWTAVMVVLGLRRLVWDRRAASVLTAAVLGTYFVGGVMETRREIDALNLSGARDRALAAGLQSLGAAPESRAVVMVADPVQFSVTTGYAAVPLPGNGLDAMVSEARALGVTHAILDPGIAGGAGRTDSDQARFEHVLGAVPSLRVPGQGALLLELRRKLSENEVEPGPW